jgi:hypothetical protein
MSAFTQYLHEELGFSTDLQYYLGGHTGRWGNGSAGFGGYPNEAEPLGLAMAKDPYLHFMVASG